MARVIDVIVRTQRLPPERVTHASTFAELGLDSLDAINIIFALEEEFDVTIANEDAHGVTSIRTLVDSLARVIAPGAISPHPAERHT
jgi:acyl carrier protein